MNNNTSVTPLFLIFNIFKIFFLLFSVHNHHSATFLRFTIYKYQIYFLKFLKILDLLKIYKSVNATINQLTKKFFLILKGLCMSESNMFLGSTYYIGSRLMPRNKYLYDYIVQTLDNLMDPYFS